MPEPILRDKISYSYFKLKLDVELWSDGTNTIAQVTDRRTKVSGKGSARRHKGDRRDQDVGDTLALMRALADLAGGVFPGFATTDVEVS